MDLAPAMTFKGLYILIYFRSYIFLCNLQPTTTPSTIKSL